MLIAILALVFVHHNATGVWTFNYEDPLRPRCLTVEYLLMLGFFIAFAVKMPVVPAARLAARCAHSQAPTAGSVDWRASC